jgi:hypothetical protein
MSLNQQGLRKHPLVAKGRVPQAGSPASLLAGVEIREANLGLFEYAPLFNPPWTVAWPMLGKGLRAERRCVKAAPLFHKTKTFS